MLSNSKVTIRINALLGHTKITPRIAELREAIIAAIPGTGDIWFN